MGEPYLPGIRGSIEPLEEEKSPTDKLCEEIFYAICNLYMIMLPGIPPDPAVFQSVLAIKTKVRKLLVSDAKQTHTVQARLLSLGGGKKGLNAVDAHRLQAYNAIMGQAYDLFHQVHPTVDTPSSVRQADTFHGDGLEMFPPSSKILDWICDEDGNYTFLRSIIHHAILFNQSRLAKRVPDVRIPCAILMVGGFPAENSQFREALQEKHGDFMQICPTQILMQLPEFYEIFELAASQEELDTAANFSADEVADITALLLDEAIKNRYNIFIEGLGANQKGYLRIGKRLARAGYRILAIGVTESQATAQRRADHYGDQTQITLNDDAINEHLTHVDENIPTLLQKAGSSILYDFDGKKPEIVWAKQGAKTKVFNKEYSKLQAWSLS